MKKFLFLVALILVTILEVRAQDNFAGYGNVKIAIVIEDVEYNGDIPPKGFLENVLITSNETIITDDDFDERLRIQFTKYGEEDNCYFLTNEDLSKVISVDLSKKEFGYYDLEKRKIILKGRINLLKSKALQSVIDKKRTK